MGAAVQEPEGGGRGAVEVLAVRGWYGGRVCASRGSSAEGGRHGGSHSRGSLPGLSVRRCQHETGCVRERAWGSAAERRRRHGWRGGGAWLAHALGRCGLEEVIESHSSKRTSISKACNKTTLQQDLKLAHKYKASSSTLQRSCNTTCKDKKKCKIKITKMQEEASEFHDEVRE